MSRSIEQFAYFAVTDDQIIEKPIKCDGDKYKFDAVTWGTHGGISNHTDGIRIKDHRSKKIIIRTPGSYLVSYNVSLNSLVSAGLGVLLNGVLMPGSIYTGTQGVAGHIVINVTKRNSVIEIVNVTTSTILLNNSIVEPIGEPVTADVYILQQFFPKK
jgi:hypothetical protein